MQVRILGPLQVVADGDPVELGGARLRALLTRLAMDAGRSVSVEALLRAVWPDGGPDQPTRALQTLVTRLRSVLPSGTAVSSGPAGYRLEIEADAVDAHRFERLARQGREALRRGEMATASAVLREALELWRGRALADAQDAPDAAAAAARLHELRLAAVEDQIEAELAASGIPGGALNELVAELEEEAAAHPLRERLHTLHIRALHEAGRKAEALAVFEQVRLRLADKLGADPGPDLAGAHLAVLRDEERLARPRGNLRVAADSFVGREAERKAVAWRLADSRVVTLTGPGGVGKTRLANVVAADASPPGGAWVVELASVTNPSDLVPTIVATLGLRETGLRQHGSTARLVESLAADEILLVLDNCEHLIENVARLVDELVGSCPQLLILATSREPLGIAGESLVVVPPLELPGPDGDAWPAPAVRLFADRAVAARHDFALTESNAGIVAEICRRLDGLPLAIELAAARLRSMSLERLSEGLDDRFALLARGYRTALPRHQTLRAVVAWSWELLDGGERAAAERLAVFPASFSAPAAEAVGAAPDALAGLVDKSLVHLDGDRYRMLETIREYGLAHAHDRAAAEAAFVACFVDLAEGAKPYLAGRDQLALLARLAPDHENLNEALRIACDSGAAEAAVRLGAALSHYWAIQGDHAAASRRLLAALRVPGETPAGTRETAIAGYLFNTVLSGDAVEARAAVDALRLPPPTHPFGTVIGALLAAIRGDAAAGFAVLDGQPAATDAWMAAVFAMIRAFLHILDGGMAAAKDDYLDAARHFQEAGDVWGRATSLTYGALTQGILGDPQGAIATMRMATQVARALGSDAYQRVWLGILRIDAGDVDQARADLAGVLASRPSAYYVALARVALADLSRHDGDLAGARQQLAQAAAEMREGVAQEPTLQVLFHSAAGRLALTSGELATAERHLNEIVDLGTKGPDMPLVAMGAVGLAMLVQRQGDASRAGELLGAAHGLRGTSDSLNPDVARLTAELRSELGEPAYEAAYARGRAMPRDAAVAFVEAQARRR